MEFRLVSAKLTKSEFLEGGWWQDEDAWGDKTENDRRRDKQVRRKRRSTTQHKLELNVDERIRTARVHHDVSLVFRVHQLPL